MENWGGNGFGSVASANEIGNVAAGGATYPYGANTAFGAPPRGVAVAGGAGAFTSSSFGYGANTEQLINGVAPIAWFKSNNEILSRWVDAGLNANVFEPLNGTPTLIPAASSKLTTGADFTGLTGFTVVAYRGAFGTTDWTTGWVNWNPQQTDYSH